MSAGAHPSPAARLLARARVAPVRRVLVVGRSMEPTLQAGDHVLVRVGGRVRHRIRPGDIVLARLPDRPIGLKRAVQRVPGGWDLRGDAPAFSTDSRQFGPVGDDDVVGRVLVRYWPPRRGRPAG